jgi:low affinity Fe/Cu permease
LLSTQNRDAKAVHLKLDELLRALAKARTGLVGLEHMTEDEINDLQAEFTALQAKYANRAEQRARRRVAKPVDGASKKT